MITLKKGNEDICWKGRRICNY